MPKASFITTFFNNEKTIREAILSLLEQTVEDIEVIAIDDGSTDNSLNIVKEINDNRIIIITGEKLGRVGALNKGLSLAKAKYVGILDADDIALPRRTEVQMCFLEQNSDISLVFSNVELISESGTNIGLTQFLLTDKEVIKTLFNLNPFAHSSVMYKKEDILKVGGYNSRLERSIDYNLYLELLLNGFKLRGVKECVTQLRVSKNSWGKVEGATIQFFYGSLGLFNYYTYQKTNQNLLRSSKEQYEDFYQLFSNWYKFKKIKNIVLARSEASHALDLLKQGKMIGFLSSLIKTFLNYPTFWKLKKCPINYPSDFEPLLDKLPKEDKFK